MPDVPNLPGVPPLPSYAAAGAGLLLTGDVDAVSFFAGPQWGIFLDGAQAFPYNSIVDFDYKQDFPVSDYPVEDGGFLSYDKVQLPFDVRVRVASGPTEQDRQDLLVAAKAAANTLDLYDVVTPEDTYSSCNITHVDWKRTSVSGVGLVVVDFWFVEIRQTATSTFSSTQTPAVAGQQNTGSVAPQSPDPSLSSRIDAAGGVQ